MRNHLQRIVCVCVFQLHFLCSTQRLFDHPQIVTCFAHVHPQGQVLTTPTKPLETLLDPTTQSNHWGPQAKSVNDGPLSCLTGIPKPRCWCNHWSFWSNFKAFLRRAGVEVVFLFCCHCAVYNKKHVHYSHRPFHGDTPHSMPSKKQLRFLYGN